MGRATRILFSFPARRFPFRLIVHSDRPLDRSLAGTGNQLTLGWRIHRAFGDVCDPTSGAPGRTMANTATCAPPNTQPEPAQGVGMGIQASVFPPSSPLPWTLGKVTKPTNST